MSEMPIDWKQKVGLAIAVIILVIMGLELAGFLNIANNTTTSYSTSLTILNPEKPQNNSYTLIWDNNNQSLQNFNGLFIPNSATFRYFWINVFFNSSTLFFAKNKISMYASGTISTALVKNLVGIDIVYGGFSPYDPNGQIATVGFGDELEANPTAQIPQDLVVGNTTPLVQVAPVAVEWQASGTFYPTVYFDYQNGSQVPFSFSNQTDQAIQILEPPSDNGLITQTQTTPFVVKAPDNLANKESVFIIGSGVIAFVAWITDLKDFVKPEKKRQ